MLTSNINGEQLSSNMVNYVISPFELYFTLMSFISVFVEIIKENVYTNQTTVRTTSKKMSHNVESFLSSKLGHNPKRSIELLGRVPRSVFHHKQNHTPINGMRQFPWVYQPLFHIQKFFHSHRWKLSNMSDNVPKDLEIMSCKFFKWVWSTSHSLLWGCEPLVHTRLTCHFSRTKGYLA